MKPLALAATITLFAGAYVFGILLGYLLLVLRWIRRLFRA